MWSSPSDERGITELHQTVALLGRTLTQHRLVTDEGRAVLKVIEEYSRTWHLLLAYDENRLANAVAQPREPVADLALGDAQGLVIHLRQVLSTRGETSELFGLEREQQLGAILGAIKQTFDGVSLYRSAQARAATCCIS